MHRLFLTTLVSAGICLGAGTAAQAQSALLDLPRDSQHAVITQKIGITDITINYHRPLVKGRQVFGKLEPYGKVWRAGANENTTIAFSDPVTVEGKALPAGIYGLHMIPGESEWTVIFSKTSTAWGSFSYDQKDDALRVTVKPAAAEFHEALTYDFDDPKVDSTVVTMRWDKTAVPFKVEVNTHDVVEASLHKQLLGRAQYNWDGWDDAATYLADQKYDLEDALKYEDRSIQIEDRFENSMTKARVLEMLNRKDESAQARAHALALANAIQLHVYGRQLQQQGKQDEAFDVFRVNIKKNPNHWLVHNELARLAVSKGDYDTAVKEMKLSAAGATDGNKPAIEALVKRLENKEDINK